MTELQDKYSISALCDRFNISDRTLRRWVENLLAEKKIVINPIKQGQFIYYSEESVKILEQYCQHLRADPRNTIVNFELINQVVVEPPLDTPMSNKDIQVDLSKISGVDLETIKAIAFQFAIAFAQAQKNSTLSPVDKNKELLECAQHNFWLSTSEVEYYCGAKPYINFADGDRSGYRYGKFLFEKIGKIGRENAWAVTSEIALVN